MLLLKSKKKNTYEGARKNKVENPWIGGNHSIKDTWNIIKTANEFKRINNSRKCREIFDKFS
jgi:hypothetical protein